MEVINDKCRATIIFEDTPAIMLEKLNRRIGGICEDGTMLKQSLVQKI
jgi:hypothetical protein